MLAFKTIWKTQLQLFSQIVENIQNLCHLTQLQIIHMICLLNAIGLENTFSNSLLHLRAWPLTNNRIPSKRMTSLRMKQIQLNCLQARKSLKKMRKRMIHPILLGKDSSKLSLSCDAALTQKRCSIPLSFYLSVGYTPSFQQNEIAKKSAIGECYGTCVSGSWRTWHMGIWHLSQSFNWPQNCSAVLDQS